MRVTKISVDVDGGTSEYIITSENGCAVKNLMPKNFKYDFYNYIREVVLDNATMEEVKGRLDESDWLKLKVRDLELKLDKEKYAYIAMHGTEIIECYSSQEKASSALPLIAKNLDVNENEINFVVRPLS